MPSNKELEMSFSGEDQQKELLLPNTIKIVKPVPFSTDLSGILAETKSISIPNYDIQVYLDQQIRRINNPVYNVGSGFEIYFPPEKRKDKSLLIQELIYIGNMILNHFRMNKKGSLKKVREVLFEGKYHPYEILELSTCFDIVSARLLAYAHSNQPDFNLSHSSMSDAKFSIRKNTFGKLEHQFIAQKQTNISNPLTLDLEILNISDEKSKEALRVVQNIGMCKHPLALYVAQKH